MVVEEKVRKANAKMGTIFKCEKLRKIFCALPHSGSKICNFEIHFRQNWQDEVQLPLGGRLIIMCSMAQKRNQATVE